MTTSQNNIHQENGVFDFLTTADTSDFILDPETSNYGSQETINNEPTAEEATNVSNNNELLTTSMIVSHG